MDIKNNHNLEKLVEEKSQLSDGIFCNDGTGRVWQEGWYIYQDGKIQGPLGLMEALTRPYLGNDQQSVLISRRGYGRWYELSFLAPKITPKDQIFSTERKIVNAVNTDIFRTKSSPGSFNKKSLSKTNIFEVDNTLGAESIIQNNSVNFTSNANDSASFDLKNVNSVDKKSKKLRFLTRHPSFAPSLVKPVIPDSSDNQKKKQISKSDLHHPVSRNAADIAYKDYALAVAPSIQTNSISSEKIIEKLRENNPVHQEPTKGEIIQEYFISRKKLRLGSLKSVPIFAGIGYISTFSFLWGIWIVQSLREIQYHCHGKTKVNWALAIVANIPIIHVFFALFLAEQVLEMQRQNRYKTVYKPLVLLLSIFPPACMAYLQIAINEHWLLHAKSALVKQNTI